MIVWDVGCDWLTRESWRVAFACNDGAGMPPPSCSAHNSPQSTAMAKRSYRNLLLKVGKPHVALEGRSSKIDGAVTSRLKVWHLPV